MLPVLVLPDGNLGFGFFLVMRRLFIVIVCVYDVWRLESVLSSHLYVGSKDQTQGVCS